MRLELICTGSELIDGRRQDGNTMLLAQLLRGIGLQIERVTLTGDGQDDIASALRETLDRADIVICTGGLGPTVDDRTRDAAAEVFAAPLIENEAEVELLRQKFAFFGRTMKDNNRRQAHFPEGAQILPNPIGTAPGFVCEKDDHIAIFAPGVPKELAMMAEQHMLPLLQTKMPKRVFVETVTLKTYGHTESGVDKRLREVDLGDIDLAFTATFPEIHLTLTAVDDNDENAQQRVAYARKQIETSLGEAIFTDDERTMQQVVADLLLQSKLTLATAESCTGGLLGKRLTDVPGSSQWFIEGVITYSNEAKMRRLGVVQEMLDEHGAVSQEVAEAMATGMRKSAGSDLALSITGIAGPSGDSKEKPVGTVHMALAYPDGVEHWHNVFPGDRERVRTFAAQTALDRLRRFLLS